MRLYLFELEKIMKKPLHFAAVSGCAVFTIVLWWMYADQADYSMGEGAAAALLLLGVHGLFAALLAMLNSCASGVSVVNIDNGFGGGYLAHMINRLGETNI